MEQLQVELGIFFAATISQCFAFVQETIHKFLLQFIAFFVLSEYELQHNLEELRFHDQVKTLTGPYPNMKLPYISIESLNKLLELADSKQISKRVKFAMRSIFISLAVRCDDISCTQDPNSLRKTCYFYVLSSQIYSKHSQDNFILDDLLTHDEYYFSEKHQQILKNIVKIIDGQWEMCSPYDFIPHFKDSIGGRQQALQCLIDLLLSVPQSYFISSEELFVSACFILVQRLHLKPLKTVLESYFQVIFEKSGQLMKGMKQAFEKAIGES